MREREREMAMEWSSSSGGSSGNGMMILDQAKEELQILEAEHPNRFGYLKLELNSFIFLLESQNLINANSNSALPTSSTATTQVSSTSRKRKKCSYEIQRVMEGDIEAPKPKFQRGDPDDRVDVAIDKAQACLYKIKQFKTNFCFINNTQ